MSTRRWLTLALVVSSWACERAGDEPPAPAAATPATASVAAPLAPSNPGAPAGEAAVIEQLAQSLQTEEDFERQVEQEIDDQNLEQALLELEQELQADGDR